MRHGQAVHAPARAERIAQEGRAGWLPVAVLLQTVRDGSFALTGEWVLGRAPIHALGMGFFGGMLVAMVTRVTMGHSGRPLRMDRLTLVCFLVLQVGALLRVLSEVFTAPAAIHFHRVEWGLMRLYASPAAGA